MLQINITIEKYLSTLTSTVCFKFSNVEFSILYEKSILESLVSKKSDYLGSSWRILSLVLISSQITGHTLDGDVENQDMGLGFFDKTS